MRMQRSLAYYERAFQDRAREELVRRELLRRRAVERARARRLARQRRRGKVNFVLLVFLLVATAAAVTVAMFQALALVVG
jgi:cell division septal protein FtsQ